MDPRLVTPYLIAALIAWGIYRRMRRSFGRQPVRDGRMWLRIGFLTLATAFLVATIARDVQVLAGLLVGLACGAVLGYFGLRHTKFEVTPAGRFYTPHTYIGLAVSALFIGRLLYKFLYVYDGGVTSPGMTGQGLAATYQHSPLTLAVFGALVGYYVLYYLGVLQRTKPPALGQETGAVQGK
jgi:hypothetical protein